MIHEWLTRFMTFKGVEDAVAEEMAILPGMEELFSLLRVKRHAESGQLRRDHRSTAPRPARPCACSAVPEMLNFYFQRIFPIQRTVRALGAAGGQRMTDMPLPRTTCSAR